MMGPVIAPPTGPLQRALTRLDDGEAWLVEPRLLDTDGDLAGRLWSPGVRTGVAPGSWFHRTECFGPVLGVMRVDDLDHAIAVQNDSDFGLTGGLHSLDDSEITRWLERVEVGNAYVNRGITGAIVRRQPFGGWKQSSVGGGCKAGGPGYVLQFASITDRRPEGANRRCTVIRPHMPQRRIGVRGPRCSPPSTTRPGCGRSRTSCATDRCARCCSATTPMLRPPRTSRWCGRRRRSPGCR
jgi:hypothetical protein